MAGQRCHQIKEAKETINFIINAKFLNIYQFMESEQMAPIGTCLISGGL